MYIMSVDNLRGFGEIGYYFQRTNGRPLSKMLHKHTFYEFLYISSGSCVHSVDGVPQNLHAGNLIVLTPHVSHLFLSQTADADVIALSVVCEEMDNFFALYGMDHFPSPHLVLELLMEQRQMILSMCKGIDGHDIEYHGRKQDVLQLRMLLNQIFLFCVEPASERAHIPEYFFEILEEMQKPDNASEGISAFLRLSGYSHSQLCRLTKQYLDVTPGEFINQIRMRHAYNLIVYGTMDFETICTVVGFESFSYFCKLCKKYCGCTPSKLRKTSKDNIITV